MGIIEILWLLAFVAFFCGAFGIPLGKTNQIGLGLVFVALTHLLGVFH